MSLVCICYCWRKQWGQTKPNPADVEMSREKEKHTIRPAGSYNVSEGLSSCFNNSEGFILFHGLQSSTFQTKLVLYTTFSLNWQKCCNNSRNSFLSLLLHCQFSSSLNVLYSVVVSVLSSTERQTNNMCVARSVWRWDTGPMNALGSGNMCTDRQEQWRWKRNSRKLKAHPSASKGKASPFLFCQQ